jgi:beta-lactamase superfamily II metal-dependent hydrolase
MQPTWSLSEHPKAAIREHLKSGHTFRRNVQDIDSSGRLSSLSQHGECLDLYGDGSAIVLGPNRAYYQLLVSQFRDTPTASFSVPAILQKAVASANEAVEWVAEKMDMQYESLDDSGVTSHENNSSVILLLTIDGKKLLLTSDAGMPALTAAANYAASRNIALHDLSFMQVPHHGSKHNVGKTILNRIKAGTAYVSAGATAPKHPAKKVTNALIRRGSSVFVTAGRSLLHFYDSPQRNTYSGVVSLPFYDQVEK